MGPSIIETIVRSNGKAPSPQVLHSPENHQPHSAPPSSSGTAHFVAHKARHPAQATSRDLNTGGTSIQPPQHASQALPSGDALRAHHDFDPTSSPPQGNNVSQGISTNSSKASLGDGKKADTSRPVEFISSTLPRASSSTERPPVAADVQLDDDEPIYSIGQTKFFDKVQKPIAPLYEARWEIIFPDIFDQVQSRLRRGRFAVRLNRPRALPNIQLMSAGATKSLSMPAVVVVIPKNIRAMQEFLDSNTTVQNRCKPRDGTTVELLVLACKGQSTLVGMPGEILPNNISSSSERNSDSPSDDDASMDSSDDSDSSTLLHPMTHESEVDAQSVSVVCEHSNIYRIERYGLSIRLLTKDGSRYVRGTCGGLFQLETPNSPPKQVGLMAGHLLEQLRRNSKESIQEKLESTFIIGDILYPRSSGETPQHDWALFDAAKLSYNYVTNQRALTIAQKSELPGVDTVVCIRTSRGEVPGTLSSSTSGIMLNPDQGFVHVRMIVLDQGSTITKGDSGAMVVLKRLGKILGHIIAANNNRHAYMVPLYASVAEMTTALGVKVSLATSTEPSLQHRLAIVHEDIGQAERSIQVFRKNDQPNRFAMPTGVERLKEVARKYLRDGKAAEAIPLLERAVSIQRRLPQADSRRLLSQHELGWAYLANGRVREAIEILEKVLKIRKEFSNGNDPDLLEAQHELAFAYTQNGQASEAIGLLKHVVTTEEMTLDKAHRRRLTSQHELARAYLAVGQASEAIKLLDHVVAVKESTLDKSDPYLLVSQIVLAEAQLAMGRTSDAVRLLEQVVAVSDATLSERNQLSIKSREWLDFARRQRYELGFLRNTGEPGTPLDIPEK